MSEKLTVLTVISNPQQYQSRYRLYREFAKYMATHPNVEFYTVEHAFKNRPFEITEEGNPYHIQIRGDQEFWLKENLLNIGLTHLPASSQKVAWIDADVRFNNPNWVQDTLDALDHYKFVQMFSEYSDLGPNFEVISKSTSFMYALKTGSEKVVTPYGSLRKGATGLAWAGHRSTLLSLGGLFDQSIVGSGDWYLAYSLVGLGREAIPDWVTPGFKASLQNLHYRCLRHVAGNVGYIKGSMLHYFHGKKSSRGYDWRERILKEHQFDPVFDLHKDAQGLYIVNPDKDKMLQDLGDYFRSRNEDSLEM